MCIDRAEPTAMGHIPQELLVVDNGDDRDFLVFSGGIELPEHAVGDTGVAGDHERRRAFVRGLRAGCRAGRPRWRQSSLPYPDRWRRIDSRKHDSLPGRSRAQPASFGEEPGGPAAASGHGGFRIDVALVQQVVELLSP